MSSHTLFTSYICFWFFIIIFKFPFLPWVFRVLLSPCHIFFGGHILSFIHSKSIEKDLFNPSVGQQLEDTVCLHSFHCLHSSGQVAPLTELGRLASKAPGLMCSLVGPAEHDFAWSKIKSLPPHPVSFLHWRVGCAPFLICGRERNIYGMSRVGVVLGSAENNV